MTRWPATDPAEGCCLSVLDSTVGAPRSVLAQTLKDKLGIWQSLLSTGTTVTPRHSQQ